AGGKVFTPDISASLYADESLLKESARYAAKDNSTVEPNLDGKTKEKLLGQTVKLKVKVIAYYTVGGVDNDALGAAEWNDKISDLIDSDKELAFKGTKNIENKLTIGISKSADGFKDKPEMRQPRPVEDPDYP